MKTKRLIFLIFAVLWCAVTFVSCVDSGDTSTTSEASQEESDTTLVPHLGQIDLDGFTLTFMTCTYEEINLYGHSQFNIDEMTNEPVNDAFYARNRAIEEEFNCNFEVVLSDIDWKMMQFIEPILLAETGDFNIISSPLIYSAEFAVKGYYQDILTLEDSVLRLDADYWDQDLIRDVSIDNKLDFITGELTVSDNEGNNCIFFNKDIIATEGMDNPFDLVRSGKWTFDKYAEMVRTVAKEDGDGLMNVLGNDRWGMVSSTQTLIDFMWGFNMTTSGKDKNDLPVLNLKNEDFATVYGKVFDVMLKRDSYCIDGLFYDWQDPNVKLVKEVFPSGRSLFYNSRLEYANSEACRNANISYGIIPFPKYDENQEKYYSPSSVYANGYISIPYTNDETYETSVVLEAMSYLSKDTITPEFYDRTLKNKRLQDNDSSEMLDLICSSRTYDLAIIYSWGGFYYENTYNILAQTNTYTSRVDKIYASMEAAIQSTLESRSGE